MVEMSRKRYGEGDARTVVIKKDRAAYNQYMRDYRARKARERVEASAVARAEGVKDE